jgi:4-amino-4-deoxy-L-arabinose transferase-like glycosyltransferase
MSGIDTQTERARMVVLCVVAVAATGLAVAWMPDPSKNLIVLSAWATACAAVTFSAFLFRQGDREPGNATPRWRRCEVAVLISLLLGAAGLRLWKIESFPIMLHNDEMSCGLEGLRFLGEDQWPVFRTGWLSSPNLGFFATSLSLRFLGADLIGLRAGSVVLGLLSLLGAYVLFRTVFGVPVAQLVLLLTIPYHWHVHLSRIGLHNIQSTTTTVWALALFMMGLQRSGWHWFALSGVVSGIGVQTYFSARLVPFVLAALVVAVAFLDRGRRQRAVIGLGLAAVGFGVACAPLIRHYVENPGVLGERSRDVLVFSEVRADHVRSVIGTREPLAVAKFQIVNVAQFISGKDNSVQYGFREPFLPVVLWPLAVLGSLLGFVAVCTRVKSSSSAIPGPRDPIGNALLWIVIAGTLSTGGLLTIDPPFSPRLSSLSVFLMVPPAVALVWLGGLSVVRNRAWLRAALGFAVLGITALVWWFNLSAYFQRYPELMHGGRRDRLARLLHSEPDVSAMLNVSDRSEDVEHQAYRFLADHVQRINLEGGDPLHWLANRSPAQRPTLVVTDVDTEAERQMAGAFPHLIGHPLDDPWWRSGSLWRVVP